MPPRIPSPCWGLLLMLGTELVSAAGVYRWVDAKGRVHYGDQPPQSGATEVPAGAAASRNKPVAPAAKPSTECEERRKQLARYREAGQITETNALGEERQFSDAQREELIRISEQKVQQACTESSP